MELLFLIFWLSDKYVEGKKSATYFKLAMHEAVQNVAKIKPAHFQCQMHFQSQIFILCSRRIAFRSLRWVIICRLSKSDRQFICFWYPTIPYMTSPIMFVKEFFSLVVFCDCCLLRILLLTFYKYDFSIKMLLK